MATFVKTIVATVRVFSPEPTEKWASAATAGAMVWGVDQWAYGTVGLVEDFGKSIPNSQPVTAEANWYLGKSLVATQTISMAQVNEFYKPYTNTVETTGIVAKGFVLSNDVAISDSFYRYFDHAAITNTVATESTIEVYRKRNDWYSVSGDSSNVVSWPRSYSMTIATATTTSWTIAASPTTVWSEL